MINYFKNRRAKKNRMKMIMAILASPKHTPACIDSKGNEICDDTASLAASLFYFIEAGSYPPSKEDETASGIVKWDNSINESISKAE
jgi:hypothetical protein